MRPPEQVVKELAGTLHDELSVSRSWGQGARFMARQSKVACLAYGMLLRGMLSAEAVRTNSLEGELDISTQRLRATRVWHSTLHPEVYGD